MKRRDFLKLGAAAIAAPALLLDRPARAEVVPEHDRPIGIWEGLPIYDQMRVEVLRHDRYERAGQMKNLRVGDVFRMRAPDGTIQGRGAPDELCVVQAPPYLAPITGSEKEGACWTVWCQTWEDFAAPLKQVDWAAFDGVEEVHLGSGSPGSLHSWPRLWLFGSTLGIATGERALRSYMIAERAHQFAFDALSKAFPELPWDGRLVVRDGSALQLGVWTTDRRDCLVTPMLPSLRGQVGLPFSRGLEPHSDVRIRVYGQGIDVQRYVAPGSYI